MRSGATPAACPVAAGHIRGPCLAPLHAACSHARHARWLLQHLVCFTHAQHACSSAAWRPCRLHSVLSDVSVGSLPEAPLHRYFEVPPGILPEATAEYYKDPVLKASMHASQAAPPVWPAGLWGGALGERGACRARKPTFGRAIPDEHAYCLPQSSASSCQPAPAQTPSGATGPAACRPCRLPGRRRRSALHRTPAVRRAPRACRARTCTSQTMGAKGCSASGTGRGGAASWPAPACVTS